MPKDYFPGVVGLKPLKNHLAFLINAHEKTGFLNNILFTARLGSGKTLICNNISRNLLNTDTKKPKKFIKIDCSSLRSVKLFMEQIIIPHVIDGQATIFLNEVHLCSETILDFLLTMLEYDATTKKSNFSYDGQNYTINFRHGLSVLAATTNVERLSKPLIDRFYRVSIPDYKSEEMAEILMLHCPKVQFQGKVAHEIVEICRANPRNISQRIANNIINYLNDREKGNKFTVKDWHELREILGIRPHGITDDEYKLLTCLIEYPHTLTALSTKLQLDSSTVRQDVEHFLLDRSYMQVDVKRFITHKGQLLLQEIKEWEGKMDKNS